MSLVYRIQGKNGEKGSVREFRNLSSTGVIHKKVGQLQFQISHFTCLPAGRDFRLNKIRRLVFAIHNIKDSSGHSIAHRTRSKQKNPYAKK
jgi:hypothetical protein